jgi:hypothetical protein
MQSMTAEEARESFDRLLEMAKHESVILRDGDHEVAVTVPMSEHPLYCRWLAIQARDELAADAAAKSRLCRPELSEGACIRPKGHLWKGDQILPYAQDDKRDRTRLVNPFSA